MIFARKYGFMIAASVPDQFECDCLEDGSLVLWCSKDKGGGFRVSTSWDSFVEVVDREGTIVQSGGGGGDFVIHLSSERVMLRLKALPDPNLSAAEIEAARQSLTRYVVSGSPCEVGVPSDLADAIAWLQAKMADIPEPCRASAKFEIDTEMKYGDAYLRVEITYEEPESDEEVVSRVQVQRERARLQAAVERKQFERLKAKYDGGEAA